jgi:glutaconate CoA-transferase subunit A
MSMTGPIVDSVDALAALVSDGAKIALYKGQGAPMALIRALIRRQVRDLHVVTVPTAGLSAELLIGAGCVATVETSGVTLDEFGLAPQFVRAVSSGAVRIMDSTCPAVHAAIQAGAKGIPFIPIRGLLGSDILANRDDYKVIDNPFAQGDPIVLLPAIRPDVAIFHVAEADRFGNVWIGGLPELKTMAAASRAALVTAERIVDGNLMEDPVKSPTTVSALYITALAEAPRGAAPLAMPGLYQMNAAHLRDYTARARTVAGFAAYLQETVFGEVMAAE